MLQFLILLVDHVGGEYGDAAELCIGTLRARKLRSAAAWLAAARASEATQRALGTDELYRKPRISGHRELFARAYFFAEARDATGTIPERLSQLCTPFDDLVRHGLEDYVANACMRWLAETDAAELADAMSRLSAFSGPARSTADRLAAAACNAVFVKAGGDLEHCLAAMFEFARRAHRPPLDPRPSSEPPGGERRFWFGTWATIHYCNLVFRARGVAGFDWLRERGWYAGDPAKIDPAVRDAMRAGADLALGYWYRGATWQGRQEYVLLVEGLADGTCEEDHLRAGYLIRHSAGRRDARVDPEFCRALSRLLGFDHVRTRHPSLAALHRRSCDRRDTG